MDAPYYDPHGNLVDVGDDSWQWQESLNTLIDECNQGTRECIAEKKEYRELLTKVTALFITAQTWHEADENECNSLISESGCDLEICDLESDELVDDLGSIIDLIQKWIKRGERA